MAKKKAADPVREAISAIRAVLDSLPPEHKEYVEVEIFNMSGYFDEIRGPFSRFVVENYRMALKLRDRHVSNITLDRKVVQMRDVQRKSYGQIAAHLADETGKTYTYNAIAKRYAKAKKRRP
jgi:hypothetical protein